MARGWPVTLTDGRVRLRPLRRREAAAWSALRKRNAEWLVPWEATPPGGPPTFRADLATYLVMVRSLGREARAGRALPFAIHYDGVLVGQLTVSSVIRGSLESASVGYWVDQRIAGRGVMPSALALSVDHCLGPVGLHRIEANVRPENTASRRVVEKLGFREEGLRRRLLHIDGDWRDHLCYAVTTDDVPEGVLARWRAVRHQDP